MQDQLYRPYYCQENVYHFLSLIRSQAPHFDLKDVNVLYFAHEKTKTTMDMDHGFYVQNARQQNSKRLESFRHPLDNYNLTFWHFHLALEHRGWIYDMDYSQRPQPVEMETYLRRFFVSPSSSIVQQFPYLSGTSAEILVFQIPAIDYLKTSDELRQSLDLHRWVYESYPSQPLLDFQSFLEQTPM